MRGALTAVGLLLAMGAAAQPARADPPDPSDLERLEAAADANPNDPDLAWALAAALEERGEVEASVERFRGIAGRWPALRGAAYGEIGRIRYERGDPEAALEALDRAVRADPDDPASHLYRGLALITLGRPDAALSSLRRAGALDPDLRSRADLIAAAAILSTGGYEEAVSVMEDLLEREPEGEAAEGARRVLERAGLRQREPWIAASVTAGADSDSNVTLDSGLDTLSISTDESDVRAAWGARLLVQAIRGGWGSANLGYAYSETSHEDLKSFDSEDHRVLASVLLNLPRSRLLRLDGVLTDAHLDDARYVRSWLLRPNLWLAPRWGGLTRLYAEVERRSYDERPISPALDRDGVNYMLGADQLIRLPGWEDATLTLGVEVDRTNTEAHTDALGFQGDHDRRGLQTNAELRFEFPGRLSLRLGGRLAWDRYGHRSLMDALTDEGVGTSTPSRRHDGMIGGHGVLSYPLREDLRVELRWQGERHRSNVDVYDYERHVVGLQIVGERFWP